MRAMKVRLVVFSILLSVLSVSAQQGGKIVFWSGDPGCGSKSKAFSASERFVCSSVSTERGPVSTIQHNGLMLSAAFLEDSKYHIAGVIITNQTSEPLQFDADNWGAAHFKSKAAFQERKKPLAAETSIPSRDILRIMATRLRYESSLDTFIAEGQKTTESREIKRPDGTKYNVNVIVPDKETQRSVARQNLDRADMVMSEQRRIRATALTSKSVQPGHSVKGLVYFRRFKGSQFVVFSLSIEDTTYVFQLQSKR